MRCPTCKVKMEIRSGKFGEFYFCPRQYDGCTQKTISKSPRRRPLTVAVPKYRRVVSVYDSWENRSKGT